MSIVHVTPSPVWAQAAAEAAETAAADGEAELTLPDGTAAVLMTASRALTLRDQAGQPEAARETAAILRSRRSRRRLARSLADLAAGRTYDLAAATAVLDRRRQREQS